MIQFEELSREYAVRRLTEEDLPEVLALARGNPVYYEHLHEAPALETLREDMTKLPSHAAPEDKYFLGYFRDGQLCAVLDLITRYPDPETAFIGWFILRKDLQGRGIGTALVNELLALLKAQGFCYVRLGYVKGNPESKSFWEKNKFTPAGVEVPTDSYIVVVLERSL